MKNDGDWFSWALGLVGGVLLWENFKPKATVTPAQAAAQVAKGKYPNLGAVSARIDAVWAAFQAGKMTADAAMAEAKELADAANSFSLENGEDATVIYAQALALQDSIQQAVAKRRPTFEV
jgi:hypothetical protein